MTWTLKANLKSTVPGPQGPRGFDGVNSLPTDTALASYADDPQGVFRGTLDDLFSPRGAWSVKRYGAAGDGITDDTAAFNAAFTAARNAVLAGFGAWNVVEVPAGRYKITSTIAVAPYLKLRSLGQVVLEWWGTDSTCLWVSPVDSDPTALYAPFTKHQEQNADIIDGSVGGVAIANMIVRDGVRQNTGLELGSRADLGSDRPLARYGLHNIAITGFDTGVRMNVFNHYIGHFSRFQIETNTVSVAIGSGEANANSGENFTWDHCVFASCDWAFDVRTSGFDHNFVACSMDFLYKGAIQTTTGYQRYFWSGGHIEAVNYPTPDNGGIVVSSASSGEVYAHFDGTTVLARKQSLFRGTNLYVSGTLYSRLYDDDVQTAYPAIVMSEPTVRAVMLRNLQRTNRTLISRDTNRIQDPLWQKETVGAKATLLDWVVVAGGGATFAIVADSPDAGGQALQVTLPINSSLKLTYKNSLPKYDLDEFYGTCVLKTTLAGVNANFAMQLWGADGSLIVESGNVAGYGVTSIAAGSWNMPRTLSALATASFSSFSKAASFRPIVTFSNPAGASGTAVVTVPLLYAGR